MPASQKTLLLISEREDDQLFAASVAQHCQLPLQTVPRFEDAVVRVMREKIGAIFMDISTGARFLEFKSAFAELETYYANKVNANNIHLIATTSQLSKISHYTQSPLLGNFIIRRYSDPVQAGIHYARILNATLATSPSERAFGLGNLGFPPSGIRTFKFQNTGEKAVAVKEIDDILRSLSFRNKIAEIIANAADEMIMNALFDSPVDASGSQTLENTPRSTKILLPETQRVEMQIGHDENYFGMTVVDTVGSLNRQKVLSHIMRLFRERTKRLMINDSGESGGVGLAMTFNAGASMFFASEPHVRTEVSVFYQRMNCFKSFRNQFQFVSSRIY